MLQLIEQCEAEGGLNEAHANEFVTQALETFHWHTQATVSAVEYDRLYAQHRLIADVVAFKGPHINHLTPRTLDIAPSPVPDPAAQDLLPGALQERIAFPDTYEQMRAEDIAYVRYSVTEPGGAARDTAESLQILEALIATGHIRFDPLVYEDFLPISAAGHLPIQPRRQRAGQLRNQLQPGGFPCRPRRRDAR